MSPTTTGKLIVDSALRVATHLRSSSMPHHHHQVIKSSTALLSAAAAAGGKATLPDLPYDYNALQPAISAETMTIHHTKHHQAYVTNWNISLEKLDAAVAAADITSIIALQGALKFNGGGHVNHSLFWETLSPTPGTTPSGALATAITASFGSYDAMKAELSAKSIAIQGSGWGWIGYNTTTKRLEVATCANQDPLLATTGLVPIVGIDVWEHAYYVDYRNVRPEYVKSILDIINWKVAEERFVAASK
jgi:superoxide dismutase, Fe-Mn family